MIAALPKRVYETGIWHRLFKPSVETDHWVEAIERIIRWYEGNEPYFFPCPTPGRKETRFDLQKNALLTFARAEREHATYLHDLCLKADAFVGMKVADIGSGPLPTLAVFRDCERYCIDYLLDAYRWYGFPVEEFEKEVHYVNAHAEKLPFADGFFDIVLSRDALDHVDNFKKSAAEISRVLRRGGGIHIMVNYHEPTGTEPIRLSDEDIARGFGRHNLRKVLEVPDGWGFKGGCSVLWSNLPAEKITCFNEITHGLTVETPELEPISPL